MAYEKVELPPKLSRRTHGINLADYDEGVYVDLLGSPNGMDSNYFAILGDQNVSIEFAMGGFYNNLPGKVDPLPGVSDFHQLGPNGHYEAQGRLFTGDIRLWFRGRGIVTIVY